MSVRHYPGINVARFPPELRTDMQTIDTTLRAVGACLSENQPATTASAGAAPGNASFITTGNEIALSDERRLVVSSPLSGTDAGPGLTYTLGVTASAMTALLAGTPAIAYSASAAAAGSAATVIRTDATLLAPTFVRSSANNSTLTLTDDATDQTLTGSLGALNLRSGNDTLSLPLWTGGGANAATVGAVLGFAMQTAASGTGNTLTTGINAQVSFNTGSLTFTGTKRAAQFTASPNATSGIVFSSVTLRAVDAITSPATMTSTSGPHTFTEITALRGQAGMPIVSSSGNVTVTDAHGLHILGWPTSAGAGTAVYTNARGARIVLPTLGQTIRRGLSIETVTTNIGTEAANVEGLYVEDLARGTAQRVSAYFEGATTGTPTDVYALFQGTAHVVGTNRYGARFTGATTGTPTLVVGVQVDAHSVGTTRWAFYGDGDASHFAGIDMKDATDIVVSGTTGTKIGTATTQKLGFWNATPVVQQAGGKSVTNNVTAGGTADQADNFTDLVVYANDAAVIRNNIYQLWQKVDRISDGLRTTGILADS